MNRIVLTALAAALALPVAPLAATSASAAVSCVAECLSSHSLSARPEGFEIVVTTSVPTTLAVEVFQGTTKIGTWTPKDPAALAKHTLTVSSTPTATISPATFYTVKTTVKDAYGATNSRSVVARTATRYSRVLTEPIKVKTDGDPSGAGEICYIIDIAGRARRVSTSPDYVDATFDAPDELWMSDTVRISNMPSPARLRVTLIDDDRVGTDDCNQVNQSPYNQYGSGSNPSANWQTATSTMPLWNYENEQMQRIYFSTPAGTSTPDFSGSFRIISMTRNVPDTMAAPVVAAGNGQIRVDWNGLTPKQLHASALVRYEAVASTGQSCTAAPGQTTCMINGLTNGTPASIRVRGVNGEGAGWFSPWSAKVTPRPVPGTPSVSSITQGETSLALTLKAPSSAGGARLQGYRITMWNKRTDVRKVVETASLTANITGLTYTTPYAFSVTAVNAYGESIPSRWTAPVPTAKPSTLTGFPAAPAVGAVGSTIAAAAKVGPGTERQVTVQYRRKGTTSWSVHGTLQTGADQTVSFAIPVKQGIYEWRLFAPAKANGSYYSFAPVTSGIQTVSAKTAVAGFNTSPVTAAAGTALADDITVTPGFLRTVWVQARKAGTSTWLTYSKLAASNSGQVTVKEAVYSGLWFWRVYVPETTLHGAAVASAERAVTSK